MIISIQHCSDAEVPGVEAQWQAEGYRCVVKAQDTDLGVMEYLKRPATGRGEATWMLVRREPNPSVRL